MMISLENQKLVFEAMGKSLQPRYEDVSCNFIDGDNSRHWINVVSYHNSDHDVRSGFQVFADLASSNVWEMKFVIDEWSRESCAQAYRHLGECLLAGLNSIPEKFEIEILRDFECEDAMVFRVLVKLDSQHMDEMMSTEGKGKGEDDHTFDPSEIYS